MTTHEPVNLRQPCPWPLLDQVPFEFRADIVQRFNCVVSDLQTARRVHAANPSAREYRSLLGAWVVLLRMRTREYDFKSVIKRIVSGPTLRNGDARPKWSWR